MKRSIETNGSILGSILRKLCRNSHGYYSLTNLPELVLTIIANYLNSEDLMNLTDSHEDFKFLRRQLPKHLNLHSGHVSWFKLSSSRSGSGPNFLRSPVMIQKVKSITITYELTTQHRFKPVMDEGLKICLVREDKVIDTEILSSNRLNSYTMCSITFGCRYCMCLDL